MCRILVKRNIINTTKRALSLDSRIKYLKKYMLTTNQCAVSSKVKKLGNHKLNLMYL